MEGSRTSLSDGMVLAGNASWQSITDAEPPGTQLNRFIKYFKEELQDRRKESLRISCDFDFRPAFLVFNYS